MSKFSDGRKTKESLGEIKRVRVSFTLPPKLAEWLASKPRGKRSVIVEEALTAWYNGEIEE